MRKNSDGTVNFGQPGIVNITPEEISQRFNAALKNKEMLDRHNSNEENLSNIGSSHDRVVAAV